MKTHFPQLEFHRLGIGLVADADDDKAGAAIFIAQPDNARPVRSCTCKTSKRKTCQHLRDLGGFVREVNEHFASQSWEKQLSASLWHRLAKRLFEGEPQPSSTVRVQRLQPAAGAESETVLVTKADGSILARYLDSSPARLRLLERTGKAPDGYADRSRLLERMAMLQISAQEQHFAKHGMKSQRQTWEESFWFRLAYHCVREYGDAGQFHPAIDEFSGDFTLCFAVPTASADAAGTEGSRPIVQVTVPRARVRSVLDLLHEAFPEQEDLAIHPVPLKSLFQVTQATELDLEVRPMIQALQASGEARLFARDDLARFRYGDLIYIPELAILAEVERRGKERKFAAPRRMRLAKSQVPSFLAEHAEALAEGSLVLDEPMRGLQVVRAFDRVELVPEAVDQGWYFLSARYGYGNASISLADILRAHAADLPYLETEGGWIDLQTPAIAELTEWLGLTVGGKARAGEDRERALASVVDEDDRIRLSSSQLLRLRAGTEDPVEIAGDAEGPRADLDRLFELRPIASFAQPNGLRSTLRSYQVHGVEWMRFLWENRLAGLLCDDMGLGKTHQAMALMASLREQGEARPILVICPTSVLSHWRTKIRDHAPGLQATVHHGPQRNLASALARADVIITSYGVLRRDIEKLEKVDLALAIFDEVQQLKNRATLSYEAARQLDAAMMIGMTGTPIENSLIDLKALFDLVLPGYLGSDRAFIDRYGGAEESVDSSGALHETPKKDSRLAELRRITAPFVLRRLKQTVLEELPEKIEDIQTCVLSDDQVRLYRDAIAGRGSALVEEIQRDETKALPFIHIFALLNLLKQICNHPALASKDLEQADQLASGKWDLFVELLGQALASGQKVVVFTQFLGMIDLMARHLKREQIGHAILTGASQDRGSIIDRFNEDPECRVFLGSLKAGGTGIDLVGGSVVIHYDRWWNAAREDQATDRVYRIGQKKSVQVFKLVTEGTLEEKISAIIDRKRQLMENVIHEDDPKLAKIFTREELLELLRPV